MALASMAFAALLFEPDSRVGHARVRLAGGTELPANSKYPWAAILYRAAGSCAATHVGEGYFLTASHCATGSSPISIRISGGSQAEALPKGASVFHHPSRELSLLGPFGARPKAAALAPAVSSGEAVSTAILGHYGAAFMCGSMETLWSGAGCLSSTRARAAVPQPACSPGAPTNGDSGGAMVRNGEVIGVHCDTLEKGGPAAAVPLDAPTIHWIEQCISNPENCEASAVPRPICSCG
ncbi:MAG: trypsin-like serine protease [Vicinamibacteria bacterium]